MTDRDVLRDFFQARYSAHRTVDGRHYLARFVSASKYSLFVWLLPGRRDGRTDGQSPLIYFSGRYPPRPQAAAGKVQNPSRGPNTRNPWRYPDEICRAGGRTGGGETAREEGERRG